MRVDFPNVSHVLKPGRRLALMVANPSDEWTGRTDGPTLTVHAQAESVPSHLVRALLSGTIGRALPAVGHPPRPFAPAQAE